MTNQFEINLSLKLDSEIKEAGTLEVHSFDGLACDEMVKIKWKSKPMFKIKFQINSSLKEHSTDDFNEFLAKLNYLKKTSNILIKELSIESNLKNGD